MRKGGRRFDLLFIVLLLCLAIPAEHYEVFSLLEDQTIALRHLLRVSYGDRQTTAFPLDKIVIITVDEDFYEEYGSFPLRRADIARLINNLHRLGAKVIGVDMLLEYPSSYGEDTVLADSLRRAGNVVMASQAQFENGRFRKLIYPNDTLRPLCRSGYTNMISSSWVLTSLSRLRIYPEIAREKDGWPIAVQILAQYLKVAPRLEKGTLVLGEIRVPLDHFNDIYIDFPPIPEGYQYIHQLAGITALDFLDLEDLDEDDIAELQAFVAEKIVLLGDTSTISHDSFDTPVGMVYGVEMIANTIATIDKGAPLRPASTAMEAVTTACLLILLLLATRFVHDIRLRTVAALAILLGHWLAVTLAYVLGGLVFSQNYALLAGVAGYAGIVLRDFILERNLRQEMEVRGEHVRNIFGRYLSDEIVQSILDTPGGLNLGGEKKRLTIMMADLRGFTALGERLPPENVVAVINNYLSEMTKIIVKYQGTIDEFIGDAILVIFGAPISREDDAHRAVACALEMQLAMAAVNRRNRDQGFPEVAQGIGLNTGEVVVANIGSELRSKYGVVGKNVNLTARIESYTIGGQILISESTRAAVGSLVRIDSEQKVAPKGVKKPISIFDVVGLGGEFNLQLPPKKPESFQKLSVPFNLRLNTLKGKDVQHENEPGTITGISTDVENAQLRTNLPLKPLTNLKMTLLDQDAHPLTTEIYSKVTRIVDATSVVVHFSSVPPEALAAFIARLKPGLPPGANS